MYKVFKFKNMSQAAPYMDAQVFDYINGCESESFESLSGFDLIAFDFFDKTAPESSEEKIMAYLDKEDLFFFCEDDMSARRVADIMQRQDTANTPHDRLLYEFFSKLLKGDGANLDRIEEELNDEEETIMSGGDISADKVITARRKELLRLKRYYGQLSGIFDDICTNDNGLLSDAAVRLLTVLGTRCERYYNEVCSLQEIVDRMREAYQSQLEIKQNELMKLFTVVTVIFLPLTLLVGWYGMNFTSMPEIHWRFGYLAVIAVSIATVIFLIWYFKRKKWF